MSRADQRLDGIDAALARIRELLPDDYEAWLGDIACQLAVERLWVLVGNTAERYRTGAGIPSGQDPWAELYDLRCVLAHQEPAERDPDRVWADSRRDLGRVRAEVRAHLE